MKSSSPPFRCVLLSSVVMVVMMMMQATAADIDVSVSPDQIDVGLSPSLDLNCTFSVDASSGMSMIVTVKVNRLYQGNQTELASMVPNTDPSHVYLMSSEAITAGGLVNPGGQSYMHLHWDYPTDTQKGTYECVVQGIDGVGHLATFSGTSVVTVHQVDIADVMDKLKDMETEMRQDTGHTEAFMKDLESKLTYMENYSKVLEQQVSDNEDHIKELELKISQMNYHNNLLQMIVTDHLLPLNFIDPYLKYQGKTYLVSKSPFSDLQDTTDICEAIGGQLAEVNDLDEYHALQNYLTTLTDIDFVYIGGTDEGHDDVWLLPSTNLPLPVKDWYPPNEPTSGDLYNCLTLNGRHGWRMYSSVCHIDSPTVYVHNRYMCELADKI